MDDLDHASGMLRCVSYGESGGSHRLGRLPVQVALTLQGKPNGMEPISHFFREGIQAAHVFQ